MTTSGRRGDAGGDGMLKRLKRGNAFSPRLPVVTERPRR
jgi:hypothetical protein